MRKSANDGLAAVDKPSSARIYDYLLGGEHNYAIDRAFADKQVEMAPDMPNGMRSNRAFIGRAVQFALDRGITQFVDIGAGLPSQGQAHEVADRVAPEAQARVVYIDNEEIAHAHAEILLDGEADPDRHKAVFADFFDSEELWEQVLDTGVINPDEPICLLITGILHFMFPEQEPGKALAYYRHQLPAGSLLVLSHISDGLDDKNTREVVRNYSKTTSPACLRTPEEIGEFFADWELVQPGLAWAPEWRPDGNEENWWRDKPARARYLCGVAVKP